MCLQMTIGWTNFISLKEAHFSSLSTVFCQRQIVTLFISTYIWRLQFSMIYSFKLFLFFFFQKNIPKLCNLWFNLFLSYRLVFPCDSVFSGLVVFSVGKMNTPEQKSKLSLILGKDLAFRLFWSDYCTFAWLTTLLIDSKMRNDVSSSNVFFIYTDLPASCLSSVQLNQVTWREFGSFGLIYPKYLTPTLDLLLGFLFVLPAPQKI